MLRSILSVCIMGLTGLLIVTLLLPAQAHQFVDSLLQTSNIAHNNVPIVSTDVISNDDLKEETPITSKSILQKSITPIQTTTRAIIDAVTAPKATTTTKNDNTLTAANVIDATNKERIKAGLEPLQVNEKLSESSEIKTDDMIENGYFEHVSPTGVTVSDLGDKVGYDFVIMGENLALGNFSGADDLLKAWMNSPGHRANILNESYTEIGVSVKQGQYQGRSVWFAVQHFGTRRNACPVVDQNLKSSIDSLNATLKKKETQIAVLRKQIEASADKSSKEYAYQVSTFNALVADYNAQLAVSKSAIAKFNKQVVAFNACLSKYQVAEPKE